MAQISGQDLEDAEWVGRAGIRALVSGESDSMVALCPLGEGVEQTSKLVPLSEAGGPHREIPGDWLSDDRLAVMGSFRDYVRPLVGELSYYPRPLSARLRAAL